MHEHMERAMIDQFCKQVNGSEFVKDTQNTMDLTYGLELSPRYLALQYLIGVDVLPLERSITLTGKQGSGKSVFAWFLSSFFTQNGGYTGFVDAENKTAWDQVHGVYRGMGFPTADGNFWRVAPTVQEMMFKLMTEMGSTMTQVCSKKQMDNPDKKAKKKKIDNPSYGLPLMYFIDSLSCLASNEDMKKVDKGEHTPGYAGMKRAGNLTHYLKVFTPNYVTKWPSLFVAINHEKDDHKEGQPTGGYQKKEVYSPGGTHKDFMYSLWIQVAKANGIANHVASEKRQGFTLKTLKSCFSEHGRQIGVLMRTTRDKYIDPETQEERSTIRVDFDWERALVDILTGGTVGWGKGEPVVSKTELAEFLHLDRTTKEKCTCKTLGLVDEDPSVVGAAIMEECEKNPEFYKKLKDTLWIANKKKYNRETWEPSGSGKKLSAEDRRVLFGDFRSSAEVEASPQAPTTDEPVATGGARRKQPQ